VPVSGGAIAAGCSRDLVPSCLLSLLESVPVRQADFPAQRTPRFLASFYYTTSRPKPVVGLVPPLITRAGTPTAVAPAGRSRLTTEPAPITAQSPMVRSRITKSSKNRYGNLPNRSRNERTMSHLRESTEFCPLLHYRTGGARSDGIRHRPRALARDKVLFCPPPFPPLSHVPLNDSTVPTVLARITRSRWSERCLM
jgi:hypothetical protein